MFIFESTLQANGNLNFPSHTPSNVRDADAFEVRLDDRLVLLTAPRRNIELNRLFVTLPRSAASDNFTLPCKVEVKVKAASTNVEARQQIVYPTSGVFRYTTRVKRDGRSTGIRGAVPAEYARGIRYLGWGLLNMRVTLPEGKHVNIPGVSLYYREHGRANAIWQLPLPRAYLPMLRLDDQIEVELRRA